MKPRVVILNLEVETDAPLQELRDKDAWNPPFGGLFDHRIFLVRQVSVQVAQPIKK